MNPESIVLNAPMNQQTKQAVGLASLGSSTISLITGGICIVMLLIIGGLYFTGNLTTTSGIIMLIVAVLFAGASIISHRAGRVLHAMSSNAY